MHVLRTPDDRFVDLPDYPFEPHYAEVPDGDGGTLRVHYLDEGPADAAPILLLHGEPSWSYLYRFMIPPLAAAGHRVIVPDQVGFGRSDKPAEQSDYTYARHVAWMSSLVFDHLDLTDATFFGQDWGGLIGLRLVAAQPERFARVAIGNTGLPTGDQRPSEAFLNWQQFSQTTPVFDIGFLINAASVRDLEPAEVAAHDAVPRRLVQGGCAHLAQPGGHLARRSRGPAQPGRGRSCARTIARSSAASAIRTRSPVAATSPSAP
ncbi:MAG: haloalkane dehalogenase [Ilumatobacteraceae bacterium]